MTVASSAASVTASPHQHLHSLHARPPVPAEVTASIDPVSRATDQSGPLTPPRVMCPLPTALSQSAPVSTLSAAAVSTLFGPRPPPSSIPHRQGPAACCGVTTSQPSTQRTAMHAGPYQPRSAIIIPGGSVPSNPMIMLPDQRRLSSGMPSSVQTQPSQAAVAGLKHTSTAAELTAPVSNTESGAGGTATPAGPCTALQSGPAAAPPAVSASQQQPASAAPSAAASAMPISTSSVVMASTAMPAVPLSATAYVSRTIELRKADLPPTAKTNTAGAAASTLQAERDAESNESEEAPTFAAPGKVTRLAPLRSQPSQAPSVGCNAGHRGE